jgi:hypothetical protein
MKIQSFEERLDKIENRIKTHHEETIEMRKDMKALIQDILDPATETLTLSTDEQFFQISPKSIMLINVTSVANTVSIIGLGSFVVAVDDWIIIPVPRNVQAISSQNGPCKAVSMTYPYQGVKYNPVTQSIEPSTYHAGTSHIQNTTSTPTKAISKPASKRTSRMPKQRVHYVKQTNPTTGGQSLNLNRRV